MFADDIVGQWMIFPLLDSNNQVYFPSVSVKFEIEKSNIRSISPIQALNYK